MGDSWRTILTISSCSPEVKRGAFPHFVDRVDSLALGYYTDAPIPLRSDSCVRSAGPTPLHDFVLCRSCTGLESVPGFAYGLRSMTNGKFPQGSVPISQSLVVSCAGRLLFFKAFFMASSLSLPSINSLAAFYQYYRFLPDLSLGVSPGKARI